MTRFQPLAPKAFDEALKETLLCFVLVNDATSAHAFCSRYDFGPWPLLPGVDRLPEEVHQVRAISGLLSLSVPPFHHPSQLKLQSTPHQVQQGETMPGLR